MQTTRSVPFRAALVVALAITINIINIAMIPLPSHACVGRKLILGSLEGERQGMVTRLLSILIHERTGTTIEVKYYPDREKLLQSVRKGKVDLYVDAVDGALSRIGEDPASLSPEERFSTIKSRFDEELNLIWLKPMGYVERDAANVPLGPAAVVVRKETLKTFPALPRLLEKIGTRVVLDDELLDTLVSRGRYERPAKVAREYLKEVKLI